MRNKLTRNHLAALGLVGLFVLACSLWPPKADARPLPAHHAVAAFTQGVCQPSGAWAATLTVSADVPGGTAHLEPTGVTGFDFPMPISRAFPAIDPHFTTFSVKVTVRWPDGFVADPITVTATRPPDGCTAPTTSTTTCEQAIPVRDDCATTTTPAPTTTLPMVESSVVQAPEPTTIPQSTPETTAAAVTPSPSLQPSTTAPIFLPTTGDNSTVFIVAGVGALLIGAVLLFAGRRGEA